VVSPYGKKLPHASNVLVLYGDQRIVASNGFRRLNVRWHCIKVARVPIRMLTIEKVDNELFALLTTR